MRNIKEIVLETYAEVLRDNNLDIEPNLDNKLGRESGLDSLGIVDFIVGLEDKLDISLDKSLKDIRESNSIGEIVSIIEKNIY